MRERFNTQPPEGGCGGFLGVFEVQGKIQHFGAGGVFGFRVVGVLAHDVAGVVGEHGGKPDLVQFFAVVVFPPAGGGGKYRDVVDAEIFKTGGFGGVAVEHGADADVAA